MMTDDIAQAVEIELREIIMKDWLLTKELDHFVLTPPKTPASDQKKWQILSEEVWRIANFVSYANFCSIEKSDNNGAIITSTQKNGNGFRIVIVPN